MQISVKKFSFSVYDEYFKFAECAWGKGCYQASPDYIQWIYEQNPLSSSGFDDFLIAQNEAGEIVGCIHKLRQLWLIHEGKIVIPAIHNLFVLEVHRKGCGAQLILDSLKKEAGVLVPSCNDSIANAYRKLRFQEIKVEWYRQVLRPVPAFLKYVRQKIIPSTTVAIPSIQTEVNVMGNVQYTTQPEDKLLSDLVASYIHYTKSFTVKQYYDASLFRWRFFNPDGPRHVLVYRTNKTGLTDFLVISIGVHRGLRLARIIEAAFALQSFSLLYKAALKMLKLNAIDMLAIYSADPILNQALQDVGLKSLKHHPPTFMSYKKEKLANYRINAATGDFGFDSITRRQKNDR